MTPSKAFLRNEALAAQAVKDTNFCIKEQKMKTRHNVFFGFAVLMIAAIFTLAGCDNGNSPGTDPGNGNGNGNGGGQQSSWPSSTILAEYGLSGMTAPAGVTNITYSIATVGGHSLTIYFTGSSASDAPVKNGFTSSGWTEDNDASYGEIIAIIYTKTGFLQGSYTRNGTSCQIQSAKD
jgi:hypothetical protein